MLNPMTVRKILKKGTPGRARIMGMTTPARGASKFNLGMTLHVFVEGMAPYEVQDQWIVSAKAPLGYGMDLPVKVNPKDPGQLAVDWDAHMAEQSAAGEQRRADLADLGTVGPEGIPTDVIDGGTTVIDTRGDPEMRAQVLGALGIDPSLLDTASPQQSGDPVIDQLERLTALRDAGALSDAEFEEQKRRILDA